MKKALTSLAITILLLAADAGHSADMRIWFNKPAADRNHTLGLGNGRLGAVLYHGVEQEMISISEETHWNNKPVPTEIGCRMRGHLPALWKLLDQ